MRVYRSFKRKQSISNPWKTPAVTMETRSRQNNEDLWTDLSWCRALGQEPAPGGRGGWPERAFTQRNGLSLLTVLKSVPLEERMQAGGERCLPGSRPSFGFRGGVEKLHQWEELSRLPRQKLGKPKILGFLMTRPFGGGGITGI